MRMPVAFLPAWLAVSLDAVNLRALASKLTSSPLRSRACLARHKLSPTALYVGRPELSTPQAPVYVGRTELSTPQAPKATLFPRKFLESQNRAHYLISKGNSRISHNR